MLPIGIQIDITASYLDSDLQDLINAHCIISERELQTRRNRKKTPPELEQALNNRVPGRQKEIKILSRYIGNLQKGDKSPLCLHGSTGCGKTSIVTELIDYLKEYSPQFQVLYINCLNFTSVRRIYSVILQELFGIKDKKPEQVLSNIFSNPQRSVSMGEQEVNLIILDEIDQCFSSKSFIYNILEWTQVSAIPLGSILISNMVDFASRIQNKAKSRIKFNSIIFAPYSYQELIEIVRFKYPNWHAKFQSDAITYLCKKIAGINSDVRLIQRYYNEALQRFSQSGSIKISLINIQSLFNLQDKEVIEMLKPYEFILQIIWRSPQKKNIDLDIEHYCLGRGVEKFKQTEILYLLQDLQDMGILRLNKQRRASNFYYKNWGIDLQQYAYTLEATRNKN